MRVDVNGIGLEVQVAGDGPGVLLLHGWPDTHRMWRRQVGALTDAGFRAIAPDLRGLGESDKPTDVEAYQLPYLVGDAIATLDALGVERAHLVGHDWGAAVGWVTASLHPDRVASLTALSVGHPTAFARAGVAQREKSWYMLLFQFRDVAEQWLSGDGFRNFREWSHHPEADEVAERMTEPGALSASLSLYRANLPPEVLVSPPLELPPITCPTLGIWSSGDIALTEEQMTASADHVEGTWRYERLEGVGHWIPLEAPDALDALLLDHLGDASDRARGA